MTGGKGFQLWGSIRTDGPSIGKTFVFNFFYSSGSFRPIRTSTTRRPCSSREVPRVVHHGHDFGGMPPPRSRSDHPAPSPALPARTIRVPRARACRRYAGELLLAGERRSSKHPHPPPFLCISLERGETLAGRFSPRLWPVHPCPQYARIGAVTLGVLTGFGNQSKLEGMANTRLLEELEFRKHNPIYYK
jgi:hypothetical protein